MKWALIVIALTGNTVGDKSRVVITGLPQAECDTQKLIYELGFAELKKLSPEAPTTIVACVKQVGLTFQP
jgi:hypothetical protein